MSSQVRPPRLVDYFLTVGAVDTNNLSPYHLEQQVREDEYYVITNVSIVSSDREEDIPASYHCINETVEGHYGGVNAGGYFNFNKHSGPFIAYKRSNQSQEESIVDPITDIVIRDVDEYLKQNPHLNIHNNDDDNNAEDNNNNKKAKNIKSKAASSLMSQFKKRLSSSRKDKIDLKEDDNDSSISYNVLPPPSTPSTNKKNVKWELVEGNLNKGSLGHTLQIWIERDIDKDPIIDLLIINENKKEQIPYGFNKIDISLNEGAPHRDRLCLCYKRRKKNEKNTNINETGNIGFFTPKIIDRYPLKDYDEFRLTQNVAAFCFPRGMEIIGGKKRKKHRKRKSAHYRRSAEIDIDIDINNINIDIDDDITDDIASFDYTELEIINTSQQHTFVLSSELGTRIYGACIIFYEEVTDEYDDKYDTIYIPKGICVLSHYPFYNGFLVFLNHIYCISMSPANNVPLEKYISHFFHSLPLPLCGHPGVEYNIGTKKHIFRLNARYNLSFISFPLQYLFRCLSIDDIIHLIGLILLEKQIVLISCSYSLITPCAEGLRLLMWPFEYQYNYIPVLPQSFARILEAPVPFIFGMHRSFHDELSSQHAMTKDIVSVDLDNHMITVNNRPIINNKEFCCFPKSLKNKLKQRLTKYVKLKLINTLNRDSFSAINAIPNGDDLAEDEYFDVEAVRLSFVQCFIDIFRFYRNYLEYTDVNSLKMKFNQYDFLQSLPENIQKFVSLFMKTHSFQRFIDLRCDENIAALNADLITFDYMICKTMQCISSSLNIQNLSSLNISSKNKPGSIDDTSSYSDVTSSSSVKNGVSRSKMCIEYVELECDLITQLNELQLEDPYTTYSAFVTCSADSNPSDDELSLSPYKYDSFPSLNKRIMNSYYLASKRTQIAYDSSTYSINKELNGDYTKDGHGAPKFRSIHYSTSPTLRDKLKSESMDESYLEFINDTISAFNQHIDSLSLNNKSFLHNKVKTKTMKQSISCFIHKIYETWFSIFNHHSINRLSIHTVSPKRDFIKCLTVFESMLKSGYYPTELILREIALIPAHCAMYKELVILDRWMIRLNMIPSLRYLQRLITASARRSHVEYRKFEEYYREKQLPLPIRTEFSFHDQDPTDCYPFTHAVDCAPESFFDYFLTNLPNKLLLSGKCIHCKHRLSGEEILAGFQNLKIAQQQQAPQQEAPQQSVVRNGFIENDNISLLTRERSRNRSSSDTRQRSIKRASIAKRASLSISENPHLVPIISGVKKKKERRVIKRSGQWTTLCPFCSRETVSKLELFGGIIASEYKSSLNKYQSMTMMSSSGISISCSSFRKTFNLFCYTRLHERIARIINNAYPYYPTTKLPYSFPKLREHSNRSAPKANKCQDRAIKIIRSKEELFWNLFFYFKLISLPTQFLFGGMLEFEAQNMNSLHYDVAALPHHSWCLINESVDVKRDGLSKYYESDVMLRRLHPTLYASLKPMVRDRLYDALILVLQQRGVIEEARMKGDIGKKKMHEFVMNEPLYRLFGKLVNERCASMIYSKSFNKSCERLSYTHKTRLILPQDQGINNAFAHRIQDILLLVSDTYHEEKHDEEIKSKIYDIEPSKFHEILTNHTYSQLLQINDKAQKQINIILNTQKEETPRKEHDFLFDTQHVTNSADYLFDSNTKYGNITKKQSKRARGQSQSDLNNNNEKCESNLNDNLPSKKFWKVVSDSLSPMKRRRHSVEHPCYVPRLRVVLNKQFWLTQYRWYIYYFQPRRMKYIYFILLIQEFYKFRQRPESSLSLPTTFSFYFAANNNKNKKKKRFDHDLTFDLMNMNPETQRELNCKEYAQFIYYHFVDEAANYKIQFSDQSIVQYIEDSLFEEKTNPNQFKFNEIINIKIFDKMWNAVFRYLHQMTYEPFVIWMNTK